MQSLSEPVFTFEGKDSWPPDTNYTDKTPSIQLLGTVVKHYPINVRQAGKNTGYLSQSTTSDTQLKFTAIQLTVHEATNLKTNTTINLSELPTIFKDFIALCTDSSKNKAFEIKNNNITVWAPRQIAGLLAARSEESSNNNQLSVGTKLKITTSGSTLVTKSVEAVEFNNKTSNTTKQDINILDSGLEKFKSAVANKSNKANNDDDWDD